MRVVYCGSGWWSVLELLRARLPQEIALEAWAQRGPLAAAIAEADVVLPSNAGLNRAQIEGSPKLRLIQQPAAGYDGIDLEAARDRGVPVCNAPGTNPHSVAEAALYLILALARRAKVSAEAFQRAEIGGPVGHELRGRRLTIIGRGRSGEALGHVAAALGMPVQFLTRHTTAEERRLTLAQTDVLSLHCPLSPATRHLIDAAALAALPPGAWLINCARGAIVEEAALREAVQRGHLGGVGLDVYWREPWDPTDPLYAHPDVITLPHVAGSTHQALGRIADVVAENILRLRDGRPLLHAL